MHTFFENQIPIMGNRHPKLSEGSQQLIIGYWGVFTSLLVHMLLMSFAPIFLTTSFTN